MKQKYNATDKVSFVTGAAGFIGRYLVDALLDRGHKVVALILPNEDYPAHWQTPENKKRIKIVAGDVRNLLDLKGEIGQFDYFFHLAAVVSDWGAKQHHIDITVNGTDQAIKLALIWNAHFIVTTSVCAYADALASGLITEDTPLGRATSAYEHCKQEQERLTQEAVAHHQLRATIVRPGNVFGVGSVPWVQMPLDIMRREAPVLLGKGNWDAGLVHVKNLVKLMLLISESEYQQGDVFLGSDGFGITWENYFGALAFAAKVRPPQRIPNLLAKKIAPIMEWLGELFKREDRPLITRQAYRLTGGPNIFSTRKSERLLNYQPDISFEAAMDELRHHFERTV